MEIYSHIALSTLKYIHNQFVYVNSFIKRLRKNIIFLAQESLSTIGFQLPHFALPSVTLQFYLGWRITQTQNCLEWLYNFTAAYIPPLGLKQHSVNSLLSISSPAAIKEPNRSLCFALNSYEMLQYFEKAAGWEHSTMKLPACVQHRVWHWNIFLYTLK